MLRGCVLTLAAETNLPMNIAKHRQDSIFHFRERHACDRDTPWSLYVDTHNIIIYVASKRFIKFTNYLFITTNNKQQTLTNKISEKYYILLKKILSHMRGKGE
jgi:hypothetical protein